MGLKQLKQATLLPCTRSLERESLSTITHLAATCMFVIKDYKTKMNTPTQAQPDQTLVVMVTEFCHGSLVDCGSRLRNHPFLSLLVHIQFVK